MSKVIAFKMLTPSKKFTDKIVCPPYDVLSPKKAHEIYKKNPLSFVQVTRPEVCFDTDEDPYSPQVYEEGLKRLRILKKEHYFVENDEAMLVYQISTPKHTQTGIVCGASCEEYKNSKIKKHELIREEKVNDRYNHSIAINGHAEPVILVHKNEEPRIPM